MATQAPEKTALARFKIQDAAIAQWKADFMPLVIDGVDDKAGAERVQRAKMTVVKARTSTEKVAKELNQEARDWINAVNGEKNRIIGLLEPIEDHLKAEQRRIEAELAAERTRLWREEEEAKRIAEAAAEAERQKKIAEENARLAEQRAELERQMAELNAARQKQEEEAAAAQMAQAMESRRLAAERQAIDDSRRRIEEAQAAERARIKAQQDAIEAERQRVADAEAARLRKIEDDRLAAERAERLRVEAESRRKLQEAFAAVATARAEALRPDAEKLLAVAAAIRAIAVPEMSTTEGMAAANRVNQIIEQAAAQARDIARCLAPAEAVEEDSDAPF